MNEQQPQQPTANPYIPYMKAQHDADFNRWLEDTNDVLTLLEHDLRGDHVVIVEGQRVWQQSGTALLNESGIRYVIGSIRHITNKNTYMSDLTEERVMEICMDTLLSINDALFYNRVLFGVEVSFYKAIINKISNVVELALMRAKNGGERKFLKQTENIIRHYTSGQEKTGIIPSIFGGKGRG